MNSCRRPILDAAERASVPVEIARRRNLPGADPIRRRNGAALRLARSTGLPDANL